VCGDIGLPFTNISSYIEALPSLTFISPFPFFYYVFGSIHKGFIFLKESGWNDKHDDKKKNLKNVRTYGACV